ncbi:MAG: hypothetical protein KJ072_07320 [Verrucomicrobia bacterium]|nr:hypothetical protein [Verrucomicrobiota bacterium]
MRALIARLIIVAAVTSSAIAAPRKIFEITFNDVPHVLPLVCNVAFFGQPPPPATVDKIVRSTLESAILVESSRDILAMAFVGDRAMNQTEYSGALVYRPAEKRIMTLDEADGIKRSGQDLQLYYVDTEEQRTNPGIKPEKKWLSVTLVFTKAPTIQKAYDAAIAEAERAAPRGLDTHVYVSVGDKTTRTTWRQLRDPSGGYVFVLYEAATKTIKGQDRILKKLRP